jgi:hypothetical protein
MKQVRLYKYARFTPSSLPLPLPLSQPANSTTAHVSNYTDTAHSYTTPPYPKNFSPTTTTQEPHHHPNAINNNNNVQQAVTGASNLRNRHRTLNATTQIFPFIGKHALDVCLSSATTIATLLDRLQSLETCAAPQVCSVALASHTLMMV